MVQSGLKFIESKQVYFGTIGIFQYVLKLQPGGRLPENAVRKFDGNSKGEVSQTATLHMSA